MKLLDSDILGILLALMTFVVPAISGVLEKKRKKKKRREAELYSEDLPEETSAEEEEPSEAQKLNEEIQELFDVLAGKNIPDEEVEEPAVEEEEILPPIFTPAAEELQPVPVEVEENVVLQTEPLEVQAEPVAQEENPIKKRIKDNPKEAIILAEILTPKFKEYN